MTNNINQILIKNKQGQLKTVSLGMKEKEKKEKKEKKIVPEPVIKKQSIPSFYFHREDEEEAMQYKNGQQTQQHKKEQTILVYVIDAIIKQASLDISDSVIARLKRVIDSRLRDVRDLLETKEVLVRPVELGGVGLYDEQVHKVLKLIEAKRVKMQEGLEKAEKELLADEKIVEKNILEQIKPISTYVHPSYAIDTNKHSDGSKLRLEPESEQAGEIKLEPIKKVPGKVINASQDIINKKPKPEIKDYRLIRDVYKKPVPNTLDKRLMGPIEELTNIGLNDFRKLGTSPKQALDKIKNKIELLTDESYEKKSAGVKAWRSSPVYQNYLSLGNESIKENKSIEDIIKNSGTLTKEEFDAIGDLSEQLSY